MDKRIKYGLWAIALILVVGVFIATKSKQGTNFQSTEIVKPIDLTGEKLEEVAVYMVDNLIKYGLAGNLDGYYEIATSGAEYEQGLSQIEAEQYHAAIKQYIKERHTDWQKATITIGQAYEVASPETIDKMDSFFGK
ncbi:MAG: hypothetical protein J5543_01460 [Bacteroidales bacterium]|nr:hypothetical protein [Bacteroidales bacterium]